MWVQNLLHHLEAATWAGYFTSLCLGSVSGKTAIMSLPSFPWWLRSKESAGNSGATGDVGPIPGSGRSPGGRPWQPTPVFLPGESHGQRSLAATVHRIAESQTRLSSSSSHFPNTLLPPIPQPPRQVLLIRPPQEPQI